MADIFKKIKFDIADGNRVITYEARNVTLDEALKIFKDLNVISFTATRMSISQYLKSRRQ